MTRASNILLRKFNESVLRAKLIRKDLLNTPFDPENNESLEKIKLLKLFYIKTIKELIYNGTEYIGISSNGEEMLRVAIDLDKYESILRRIN